MGSKVTLVQADLDWAADVARERLRRSLARAGKDRLGRDELPSHLLGATGELMFCRWLGVPWPASVDTFKAEPDVPPDWEVRATQRGTDGRPRNLKMSLKEAESKVMLKRRYVLVAVLEAEGWIIGWAVGDEVALKERGKFVYQRDPKKYGGNPALFMPASHLSLFSVAYRARCAEESA